jgi:hypothetical protein
MIPITGNESQYAAVSSSLDIRQCDKALVSWKSAYPNQAPRRTEVFTAYETFVYEIVQDDAQGLLYTACDGIPRLNITARATTQTTSTVTVEKIYESTSTYYNDTADAEYMSQFPPRPCDWNDWDHQNRTNQEICREIRDKDLELEFDAPNFAGDARYDNGGKGRGVYCGMFCEIEAGEEVALIYWPPVVTSRDICAANGYGTAETLAPGTNAPSIVTMDAITFQGKDMYLKTMAWSYDPPLDPEGSMTYSSSTIGKSILKGPFTFTSPTIYLAHHPIVVSTLTTLPNETGSYITSVIRTAGVVPLNADQVYSVRPPRRDAAQIPGIKYAQLIANGKYTPVQNQTLDLGMVSFDFGHLQNPVPASVYYDARSEDCWGSLRQSHCATITDGEYRPMLAFKNSVWKSIVSNWYDCGRPGLVDPPIALIPAYTLPKPELPQYKSAQPGEKPVQQWPGPTTAAAQEEPSRTKSALPGQQISSATATGKQLDPANTGAVHPEQHVPKFSSLE